MGLPALSPAQRQATLVTAGEARTARSELLASVADVLAGGDELTRRTRVEAVLRALPGYGRTETAALMTDCGIDPRRRVAGIGEVQRTRLLAALPH